MMGGGAGHGYGNSPYSGMAFVGNMFQADRQFPRDSHGKFGTQSLGKNVQEIFSENPLAKAKQLFKLLSKGGKPVKSGKPGVKVVKFQDGTHITFRPISKSKSPAVDINPGSVSKHYLPEHKIHFEKDGS